MRRRKLRSRSFANVEAPPPPGLVLEDFYFDAENLTVANGDGVKRSVFINGKGHARPAHDSFGAQIRIARNEAIIFAAFQISIDEGFFLAGSTKINEPLPVGTKDGT